MKEGINAEVILVGVTIKLTKKKRLKGREIDLTSNDKITNVTAMQNLVWTKVFLAIAESNGRRPVTPPDARTRVLMISVMTGGRWLVDPMRMEEKTTILINGKEVIKKMQQA